MTKLLTGICAAAIAASLGVAVPAGAAPIAPSSTLPAVQMSASDVHLAQWQGGERTPWWSDDYRGDRRYYRDGRYYHGGHRYWRGHRGYRYARPGYRYYDGFWFPPAAFITGAIIGGAIASAPPAVSGGTFYHSPEHVEWCLANYQSYRPSDNSFQPRRGPRQPCISPFM